VNRSLAAEAAGMPKKAASYYQRLAKLTREADSDRLELRELKEWLAARQ
jgi:hypothetical protein